jgi:UDP-N-acetylmuramyl pentapeptide synthase
VPVKGRSRAWQLSLAGQPLTVVDDSYNANPDSVRAAIDVLARTPGRKLLVLGDMGEVGDQGRDFHTEIGMYAHERGIDALYGLGELAAHAVRAFGEGARHYAAIETLLVDVGAALGPQATVLVKGSRFMQMERVVRSFEDSTAGA